MKSDLKTFKDEITSQIADELLEFKGDINQKFAKITTDIRQEDKCCSDVLRGHRVMKQAAQFRK